MRRSARRSQPSLVIVGPLKPHKSGQKSLLKVNQYVLLKKIGTGSSSTVWAAIDVSTQTYYAIKTVKTRKSQNVAQLDHEVNVIRRLDHPSIIRMREVLNSAERREAFVVLELSDCGSLRSLLDKGREKLSERVIASIFRQIAEGLVYLHDVGFAHLDISPSNLLVWSNGTAKITDFGASRMIEGFESCGLGTPAYQAPEVYDVVDEDNESFEMDPDKIDVYSLGATLYEAAFGKVPYEGDDVWEIFAKISAHPLKITNGTVSAELKDLIEGMLMVDPSKRLSMKQVVEHPFFNSCEDVVPLEVTPNKLEYNGDVTPIGEITADVCDESFHFEVNAQSDTDFQGSIMHAHFT